MLKAINASRYRDDFEIIPSEILSNADLDKALEGKNLRELTDCCVIAIEKFREKNSISLTDLEKAAENKMKVEIRWGYKPIMKTIHKLYEQNDFTPMTLDNIFFMPIDNIVRLCIHEMNSKALRTFMNIFTDFDLLLCDKKNKPHWEFFLYLLKTFPDKREAYKDFWDVFVEFGFWPTSFQSFETTQMLLKSLVQVPSTCVFDFIQAMKEQKKSIMLTEAQLEETLGYHEHWDFIKPSFIQILGDKEQCITKELSQSDQVAA